MCVLCICILYSGMNIPIQDTRYKIKWDVFIFMFMFVFVYMNQMHNNNNNRDRTSSTEHGTKKAVLLILPSCILRDGDLCVENYCACYLAIVGCLVLYEIPVSCSLLLAVLYWVCCCCCCFSWCVLALPPELVRLVDCGVKSNILHNIYQRGRHLNYTKRAGDLLA